MRKILPSSLLRSAPALLFTLSLSSLAIAASLNAVGCGCDPAVQLLDDGGSDAAGGSTGAGGGGGSGGSSSGNDAG